MTSDQALVIPFTMTTTPNECDSEVVSSIVVTPPSALFTVDSASRTVTIALTNNLSDAQVYSVAVSTKIDSIDKDTQTFSATIFDCTAMSIVGNTFPSEMNYVWNDSAEEHQWNLSDITFEPLCGSVDFTVDWLDGSNLSLSPHITAQLAAEPFKISVYTTDYS